MKNVTAKFTCNSVENFGYSYLENGTKVIRLQQTVKMSAVSNDGTEENKLYNTASPSGSFQITIDNPTALDAFAPGESYIFTFKKAE